MGTREVFFEGRECEPIGVFEGARPDGKNEQNHGARDQHQAHENLKDDHIHRKPSKIRIAAFQAVTSE